MLMYSVYIVSRDAYERYEFHQRSLTISAFLASTSPLELLTIDSSALLNAPLDVLLAVLAHAEYMDQFA